MAGSSVAGSSAKVALLVGQAWAKSPDGTLRALAVGDTVAANEAVVTARGAQIDLDFGDGRPLHLGGGQEVVLNLSLWHESAPDLTESHQQDAALQQTTVQKALKVLNTQGDLLDNLEETAAGAASNSSHSFVQLTRVIEHIDPSAFNFSGDRATSSSAIEPVSQSYINHAPVVEAQTFGGDEDTLITGKIVATDLENDPLTYGVVTQSAHGTVSINPTTGEFTYTPVANYNGADSFVVIVTDTHGNQTTSAVSFTINAVNDAPVSQNQSLTTLEDTPLTGTVTATDVEGDTLAYSVSTNASHGVVTVNAATGAFVYTPAANYNGADSFVVTVDDGHGGKTTSTISVGVTAVNDTPVTANQSVTTNEDTAYNGKIIATDVDGDTLAYSVTTPATNGAVVIDAATGAYAYTPKPNFFGADSFIVTVNDGHGGATTSTVTVAVTAVNDAPVATNLNLNTPEDTPITSKVVATDVDGDTLAYSVSTAASHGNVVLNPATGSFVYTPNNFYNGADSFVVTVNDGHGGTTTSTVTLNVLSVNNAPATTNQTLTTAEDTVLNGNIVATDVDGDTLSYAISTAAAHGAVVLNATTGAFTYTPSANYNGNDSFVVTVSDGNGGTTTSTISVGVTPVNDAPIATNQTLSTAEDTVLNGNIVASDVDADALTYSVSTAATHGVVSVNANTGAFVYTPAANYNGADSFVVTVNDGHGGITTSTVSVNVTPVNDAPTATNQTLSTAEDTALNGNIVASDLDADTLTYSVSTAATHGVVNVDAGTGAFVYTPAANYNGNDSFVVTVSDGKGGTTTSTISVGVTPVNDAPVTSNQTIVTNEDTAKSGLIIANDVDGDTLTYSISTAATHGVVNVDAGTGAFIYTPAANYNGADSFVVTVNDGHGGITTSTVSVNVTPVNDAPVSADQNLSTAEDTVLNGTVVATDADGDTLAYSVSTAASHGVATIDAGTGAFIYTPAANYNGADSFVVTVNDGHGGITTSTVSVNVTPVNDAAVITPAVANLIETNAVLTTGGTLSITDIDSPATFVAQNNAAGTYGHFNVAANGTWDYTTDTAHNEFVAGTTYTDTLTVTSADGTTSTITVNILGTNDAAVITSAVANLTETNSVLTTSGTLLISDVDSPATFVAQNNAAGTYGHFNVATDGTWDYTTDTAHNEFVAGTTYTDTLTVTSADGTTSTITVNILGTNDAAVITPAVANLTETNSVLTTNGTLAISDVDSPATFVAQNNVAGSNGYGHFNLAADGTWDYTTDTAHNEFVAGTTYTDLLTVTSADGATSTITVNILGTNDAAVITPVVVNLTETNSILTTSGTVAITDIDSPATFVAQNNVAGTYGHFNVATDGSWDYTTDTAHNEFVAGTTYTDSLTVTSADGTTSTITVNILGTNDAAVITPVVVNLTETNSILTTSGTVAITDIDSPATFVAQNNVAGTYGHFNLATNGTWDYTTDTAHNEFVTGTTYTDTLTVTSADGTTSTITVNILGTNDAAVITPAVVNLTETNSVLTTNGTLAISDVDSPATFVAQNNAAGTYGHFNVAANGTWDYTTDTAHNEFVAGTTYTDTLTVTSADGTTSTITVNILGTNDAAVITPAVANLTETNSVLTTNGTLLISDVDSPATFVAQNNAAGTYGHFNVATDGAWDYTTDTAHNEFVAGTTYTDSLTVTSADGTTSTITVNILGTNDAPTTSPVTLTAIAEDSGARIITQAELLTNANDVDGNSLTATNLTIATGLGSLVDNGNGTWTYTPALNDDTSVSFNYNITDGVVIVAGQANLDITPVNDAPTATNQTLTADEDTVLNGNIVAADVDGDTLTYSIATAATNGNATVDANTGAFVYTPNTNFNGADSFVVTVNDGHGGTTTSTINVGVNAINDAPVNTVPASIAIVEDTTTVLSGISVFDVDAGNAEIALSFNVTSGALNGSSVPGVFVVGSGTDQLTLWGSQTDINNFIAGNGLSYTPASNFSGTAVLNVKAVDFGNTGAGGGFNISNQVNLEISPVADTPTLTASVDTNIGTTTSILTIPTGDGLTLDTYTALEGVDKSNAVDALAVEAALSTTSTVATSSVVSNVNFSSIAMDDAYHIQGFIYLEAGKTYQIAGTRDDTLLVKLGGNIIYNVGYNHWGNLYGLQDDGSVITPTPQTITQSGYYSLEVVMYNGDGPGDLNLSLMTDGGAAQPLDTTNFLLYSDNTAIVNSGTALSFVSVNDGGYYPLAPLVQPHNYTYFNVAINSALTDTDGSETLAVNISGVPNGMTLTDGSHIFVGAVGSANVDVSAWDLTHITAIPATGDNTTTSLTVTATSTETANAATATHTQVISLNAAQNTTSNFVGTAAGETLAGTSSPNSLFGLNGDDTLTGNGGGDLLVGGKGNDLMSGGLGADTFAWQLGDQGSVGTPAVDQVNNFTLGAGGDALNISDLLQGENSGNLTNYLHFESDGTNTTVSISSSGGFSGGFNAGATDQTIVLNGVNLTGNDADIINQLKTNNNLITD